MENKGFEGEILIKIVVYFANPYFEVSVPALSKLNA